MNQPELIAQTNEYLVINKPAGMAVEPPSSGPTLRDWLIEAGQIQVGEWEEGSRLGVIHRLDTETSGVMIWAKDQAAQEKYKLVWQGRQAKKTYLALVGGVAPADGTIELSIMRDNKADKQTIAWLPNAKSRPAMTHYRRLATGQINNQSISLVEAQPVTGRTHQIRVHLKAIGHPIIGDKLYGESSSDQLANQLNLNRQFLHAYRLQLPIDSETISYEAALPAELQTALADAGIELKDALSFTDRA